MQHENKITFISKYRSIWFASLISCLIVLVHAPVVFSYPDDPIPTLDFGESERSIVVKIQFFDLLDAEVESVRVVPGPSHGRAGDPPILHVKVLDLENNTLREFNAWHPLWSNYEDSSGKDRGTILGGASGNFPFPFSPDAATMSVKDVKTQQQIVEVDVIPSLHDFCRENPDEPDCEDIVNRPPNCDADGPYKVECAGESTFVPLDGSGSSDPDGDALSYLWTGLFIGGASSGVEPTVEFLSFGQFTVELDVTDEFGGEESCLSEVEVEDTTPPTINCNAPATIKPPDAPISFSATASDICIGDINASITAFDCYTYTKKKKRIDKTSSCIATIQGEKITILDSGGVGDHITWTVIATDTSGNSSQTLCDIEVVNPAQN